ncbi:MAG: VCBS repeat-containing protein [Verrucomicrobiae bacterium]|nr:VCBS repeat-containing protein [Verrucomicrobiae bacterium]
MQTPLSAPGPLSPATRPRCPSRARPRPFQLFAGLLLAAGLTLTALAQPAAPALEVAVEPGGQVVLAWPGSTTDFVLEAADQLTVPLSWELAVEPPALVGDRLTVTVAAAGVARFFRLRHEPQPGNRPPVLAPVGDRTVMVGGSLALQLSAVDPEGDPLLFFASPVPLPANAALDAATGVFTFRPGPAQAGSYALLFGVSDGEATDTETVSVSVVSPPPGTATAITGIVLDTTDAVAGAERPVAGVRVSLLGVASEALTGADGRFTLTNIPGGPQVLDLDTGEAQLAPDGSLYAGFREEIVLLENAVNVIERPFYLPRIAANSLTTVNPAETTVVRNADLGAVLTIPPNTAKMDGTNFTGQISISLVPEALAPAALPEALGFGVLITIQPVGLTFATPVRLTLPNVDNFAPGTLMDLWSLDAGIGQFVAVGVGRVSADGRNVETISGGVRSSDWHGFVGPPPVPLNAAQGSPDNIASLIRQPNDCPEPVPGGAIDPASGDLTVVHALTPARSLGEPRSLEFIYSSQAADPMPTVAVATQIQGAPESVSLRPSFFGIRGSATHTRTRGLAVGQTIRQTAILDAANVPTGVHPVRVDLFSQFTRSSAGSGFSTETLVLNHRNSCLGVGWSIGRVARLHAQADGSQLLVEGASALRYRPTLLPDGTFRSVRNHLVGPLPSGVNSLAVADFNNDGASDCVVTTPFIGGASFPGSFAVLLNDRQGGFAPGVQVQLGNEGGARVVAADLNGDGNQDLVLSVPRFAQFPGRLVTVLGDGQGGFGNRQVVADGPDFRDVVTADVNGDGHADLLVLNATTGAVAVFLGVGDGAFQPQVDLAPTPRPITLAVADLNRDGRPDLLVLDNVSGSFLADASLSIFLGNGDGSFAPQPGLPLSRAPINLVTGDFNRDGHPDVVISANPVFTADPASVEIFLGDGQGGLRPGGVFTATSNFQFPLRAADLDADGALDLVFVTFGNQTFQAGVLLGNGGGGFGVPRIYYVGNNLRDLALADVTGDGRTDLLSTPSNSQSISVADGDGFGGFVTARILSPANGIAIAGRQGTLIPGDFTNDGLPDVFTLAPGGGQVVPGDGVTFQFPYPSISAYFSSSSDAAADLDRDGNLDVAAITGLFANELSVLLLNGRGGEKTRLTTPIPDSITWLSSADFNEDGWPDLVGLRPSARQLLVWLARGNGEFDPPTQLSLAQFLSSDGPFGVGDVNGDGHVDLAVPRNAAVAGESADIHLFLGDGHGGFTAAARPVIGQGIAATGSRIADVNGDGLGDIVTLIPRNSVRVHLGTAGGPLGAAVVSPIPIALSEAGAEILLGEFTGDGRLDVALRSSGFPAVFILAGDGAGGFVSGAAGVQLPQSTESLAVLDVNQDGVLDLVGGLGGGQQSLVLLEGKGRPDNNTFLSPPGDFAVLLKNGDGTFTRRLKNGTRFEFNAAGFQTAVVNRNGNTTAYAYEGEKLIQMTDPVGLKTLLAYAANKLTTVTSSDGRVTRFEHDAAGNLVQITDPGGSSRQFGFDARSRMVSQTDPVGAVSRYAYNSAGQVMRAELADGSTRQFSPTAAAGLADPGTGLGSQANPLPTLLREDVAGATTDGNGNVTAFKTSPAGEFNDVSAPLGVRSVIARDRNDLPTRIVRANGRVDVMTYDECGNLNSLTEAVGTALERLTTYVFAANSDRLLSRTDAEGYTWRYEYDAKGNLTKLTNPLGGIRRWEYDARGLVTARIDANGNTNRIQYDAKGNIVGVIDALGHRREVTRDEAGRPTEIVFGAGTPEFRRWALDWNSRNQLASSTDGMGAKTTRSHDAAGRLAAVQRPLVPAVEAIYDPVGRISQLRHPTRGTTTFERDPGGNARRFINALGHAGSAAFDALDRPIESTDPLGGKVRRTFDVMGNVTSVTDANGHTTRFEFDLFDRLAASINPLGQIRRYSYDRLDRRIEITKPDGVVIWQEFDCLGRLTKITTPDDVATYAYDANGNLLSAEDGDSALAFTYDARNRLLTSRTLPRGIQPETMLTYHYNAVGERTGYTDSLGNATTYRRDAAGRLIGLGFAPDLEAEIERDAAGRQRAAAYPGGFRSAWIYDETGHLSGLEHGSVGVPLEGWQYARDPRGRVTTKTGLTETRRLTYDERGFLIRGGTEAAPEIYAWDAAGRRVASPYSSSFDYNEAGRITEDEHRVYLDDANGNRIRETRRSDGAVKLYAYDAQNRLVRATLPGGSTKEYRYDALGRLMQEHFRPAEALASRQLRPHSEVPPEEKKFTFTFGGNTGGDSGYRFTITDTPDGTTTETTHSAGTMTPPEGVTITLPNPAPDSGYTITVKDENGNKTAETPPAGPPSYMLLWRDDGTPIIVPLPGNSGLTITVDPDTEQGVGPTGGDRRDAQTGEATGSGTESEPSFPPISDEPAGSSGRSRTKAAPANPDLGDCYLPVYDSWASEAGGRRPSRSEHLQTTDPITALGHYLSDPRNRLNCDDYRGRSTVFRQNGHEWIPTDANGETYNPFDLGLEWDPSPPVFGPELPPPPLPPEPVEDILEEIDEVLVPA